MPSSWPRGTSRGCARTWWGQAWLKALEDAALDSEQVKAGRRLARAGAVGGVSVRPGRVTAVVQDRDGTGHRADVLLQELSEEHWDRFVGMAAERSGHIAALLDREMPPHLVEDAATAGVELLPGLGDLEAKCDCGAWDHCGRTAALCCQVARLLDEDPFLLLLMRGAPSARSWTSSRYAASPPPWTSRWCRKPSRRAWTPPRRTRPGTILPPLPEPPELPLEPGLPPSLDTGAYRLPAPAEATHRPGWAGRSFRVAVCVPRWGHPVVGRNPLVVVRIHRRSTVVYRPAAEEAGTVAAACPYRPESPRIGHRASPVRELIRTHVMDRMIPVNSA